MDGRELGCGALQRRRAAADVVHQVFVLAGVFDASLLRGFDIEFPQNVTAETDQHEDHTFSGIMFDIKTNKLPLEYIEVSSVWVRGDLGRFCAVFECLRVLVASFAIHTAPSCRPDYGLEHGAVVRRKAFEKRGATSVLYVCMPERSLSRHGHMCICRLRDGLELQS